MSGLSPLKYDGSRMKCALPNQAVPTEQRWRLGLLSSLLALRREKHRSQEDTLRVEAMLVSVTTDITEHCCFRGMSAFTPGDETGFTERRDQAQDDRGEKHQDLEEHQDTPERTWRRTRTHNRWECERDRVDMLLYMYCTLHCSAQAVPVYLAEPDHEPETELGYQETVVDNVVEPCH